MIEVFDKSETTGKELFDLRFQLYLGYIVEGPVSNALKESPIDCWLVLILKLDMFVVLVQV